MLRYFFHIHDPVEQMDTEGVECADDRAAWHEATRACGELLSDIDGRLKPGAAIRMEVRDQNGRLCWNLDVTSSGVPV